MRREQNTGISQNRRKIMSTTRISHTTKQLKAKCLHYRNSKRCGRVAKYIATYRDHRGWHKYAVCKECAESIVESKDQGEIVSESCKGYRVVTGFFTQSREYREIT
jgi:hypothetical protein